MKQAVVFVVLAVALVSAQGPPSWFSDCVTKYGEPPRPGSGSGTPTQQQKCLLSCMATANGDSSKGWLSGTSVNTANLPPFLKDNASDVQSCASSVSSSDPCEYAYQIMECLKKKNVNIHPPHHGRNNNNNN